MDTKYAFLKENKLILQEEWTIHHVMIIQNILKKISWPSDQDIEFDGAQLLKMDTAGAWLIVQLHFQLEKRGFRIHYKNFSDSANYLIQLIIKQDIFTFDFSSLVRKKYFLINIGLSVCQLLQISFNYIIFIGKLFLESLRIFLKPKLFRYVSLANQINITGFDALPIIGLLSFMVGVVLAYQMGLQLKNYGANIFVVDLIGLSVLREFAPLLTAIMVAGRTGSAFTAQLGMMKITQEIDALRTMGITPEILLLIPRVVSLLITLPLLTIWADLFGLLGGIVMANSMFGITAIEFLHRLQLQVPLKTLLIGVGKTPIFALIIASIGCFQGMQVAGNADSLGKNTTRSVVVSIFLIIVADALFSIIFSQFSL